MFLYNSLLLLCSAVSKYQSQIGWEGRGLCPVSEGMCGEWWELSTGRLVLSLLLSHWVPCLRGQCPPVASTIPVSFGGDRGSAQQWKGGGYPCTPSPRHPGKCDLAWWKNSVSLRGSISLARVSSRFHCQLHWGCSCFQLLPIKHFAGLTTEASARLTLSGEANFKSKLQRDQKKCWMMNIFKDEAAQV